MEKQTLKNELRNALQAESFSYNYKYKKYVKSFNEIYCVINLQKSNFCNGYYINYYIFCKELHEFDEIFKLNIGDIMGRLTYDFDKNVDLINLDECDEKQAIYELNKSVHELNVLLEQGLKKNIELFPNCIRRAPFWASSYFKKIIGTR